MKQIQKDLLVTSVCSLCVGGLAIVPIVNSDNGYVAAFDFLALLILIGIVAFILFFVGLVTMTKRAGPIFMLSAILLPIGFFGAALVAKTLELGAYREEPMVSLTPEIGNIVLFKQGATYEQIRSFWEETIATESEDKRGFEHLPGIRGIGSMPAYNGYEAIEFHFFDSATEEQREFVYSRVRASPIVFELRTNVRTEDYMIEHKSEETGQGKVKKVVNTSSTNAN